MTEFEELERESAKLTATVEEFLAHVRANNEKVAAYLSGLQIDPLPDFEYRE
jgi:hypothetical protein